MTDEKEIDLPPEDTEPSWADSGYVLVARDITLSSLWGMSPKTFKLAMWFITKAVWQEKGRKWFCRYQQKQIIVQRGELITTIKEMADQTKMTRAEARVAFKNLCQDGMISDLTPDIVKLANGYKHIKLLKYAAYQNKNTYLSQRLANESPTISQHKVIREEGKEEYLSEKKVHTLIQEEIQQIAEAPADSLPLFGPEVLKPAKPKKEKPPPDPRIKQFIDFAVNDYHETFHVKLHVEGGKDGTAAKRALATYDLAALQSGWHRYLTTNGKDGAWYKQHGYSIAYFCSNPTLSKIMGGTAVAYHPGADPTTTAFDGMTPEEREAEPWYIQQAREQKAAQEAAIKTPEAREQWHQYIREHPDQTYTYEEDRQYAAQCRMQSTTKTEIKT